MHMQLPFIGSKERTNALKGLCMWQAKNLSLLYGTGIEMPSFFYLGRETYSVG